MRKKGINTPIQGGYMEYCEKPLVVDEKVAELAKKAKAKFGSATGRWTRIEPPMVDIPWPIQGSAESMILRGMEEVQKDLGDAINKVPVPKLGPPEQVIEVQLESSASPYDFLAAWSVLTAKKQAPENAKWVVIRNPDMSEVNSHKVEGATHYTLRHTGLVRCTLIYYEEKPFANHPSCLWELEKIPNEELSIPTKEK